VRDRGDERWKGERREAGQEVEQDEKAGAVRRAVDAQCGCRKLEVNKADEKALTKKKGERWQKGHRHTMQAMTMIEQ